MHVPKPVQWGVGGVMRGMCEKSICTYENTTPSGKLSPGLRAVMVSELMDESVSVGVSEGGVDVRDMLDCEVGVSVR
jgi:hypothetical protein